VEDRGHVLQFSPSPAEVHRKAAEWFWDQEVFDFLGGHLHFVQQPSFRHYIKASELKVAGMDWRSEVLRWLLPDRERLIVELKADLGYPSEEDWVKEFVKRGQGSRATYFSVAKRLPKSSNVPSIMLQPRQRPESASSALATRLTANTQAATV
jgi:hypothetical protein